MASTNIYKNLNSVVLAPTGGGPLKTITSVISLSVSDNTDFLEDGSDDDTSPTFTEQGPLKGSITLECRDMSEIAKVRNATGVLYWTNVAAQGSDADMCAKAVSFGQPGQNERWGELQSFTVNGRCGAFGLASDVSV